MHHFTLSVTLRASFDPHLLSCPAGFLSQEPPSFGSQGALTHSCHQMVLWTHSSEVGFLSPAGLTGVVLGCLSGWFL